MPDPKKAKLLPAFYWTCPNCSAGNFAHVVPVEFTRREKRRLARELDMPLSKLDADDLYDCPEEVVCPTCGGEFECDDGL